MSILTANELKTRGISALEQLLQDDDEVMISVRGKERFVVMDIDTYNRLREYELAAAVNEVREDIAAGRYRVESVEDHLRHLEQNEDDSIRG
jgi:prevent-host-death family protein